VWAGQVERASTNDGRRGTLIGRAPTSSTVVIAGPIELWSPRGGLSGCLQLVSCTVGTTSSLAKARLPEVTVWENLKRAFLVGREWGLLSGRFSRIFSALAIPKVQAVRATRTVTWPGVVSAN
jgi:hypothetical protein